MQTRAQSILHHLQAECVDPHRFLGLHSAPEGKVIRIWRPGAEVLYLELFGEITEAQRTDPSGLFEVMVPVSTVPSDYRIYHTNGLLAFDPYTFLPTFGEVDAYLFGRGLHYQIYQILGARITAHQGRKGTKFAVWAPNAKQVSLVGDFNGWDGRVNPMRSMGASGVWELFVPGLSEGERYKFEIRTETDALIVKADPYALSTEKRPATASVVADIDRFSWKDQAWMEERRRGPWQSKPINIYEVHLGSWRRTHGQFWNYRELAHVLAAYCQEMHFTHVELLPLSEHPLDESWGYQVTGFFAVTSRFGTPEDFQYFVNHLHEKGIGVILDWVPAHFPVDEFSLARFDGSYLYEHADPKKGFHPHWNTYIFNYGRHEVCNFLIGSALFWLEKMHIDGLRVDAVASMLYLDYGREEGQWIPNICGGKENLEAIEFLKHLNAIVHEKFPGVLMCAEESTAFPGVTHPLQWGGLGFDLKWNMGWMNDSLRYFHRDPLFRSYHQQELTFALLYAFTERFLLVLSHDEVVHGKKSLIAKMPGDDWQKFANLRLLYTFLICQPGKKLLFMGGEWGQWTEWSSQEEVPWYLLNYPLHQGLQRCVAEVNALYQKAEALHQCDFDARGFEWVDFEDKTNCVISYLRKADGQFFLCIHHFTPNFVPNYLIHLPHVVAVREVFNSDAEEYGGSGKTNSHVKRDAQGIVIQLSPLATLIFEVEFGN